MVRVLTTQASHAYGVLDPLVIERRDTKFVAASLSDALNVVVLPQGGYVDRGGSTRMKVLRRKLSAVAVTTGMLSAPNGGTVANLTDGDDATVLTTAAIAADPFTVLAIDLGAPTGFCALDATGFLAGTAARDDCVHAQYWDGVAWQDICAPFHLRTEARARRFARDPGLGNVTAQLLRITVTGGTGPGTITLGSVALWQETGDLSAGIRARAFNYAIDTSYQMVLSHLSLDVFRDGVWQAAVAAPWTEDQVATVKSEFDYDTMLLFHGAVHTRALLREGSDREWQMSLAPYENIPRADFGGAYVNGVNEVQRLTFSGFSNGDEFQLILEGQKTDSITVDTGSWANTALNVKAALEDLPNVDPGLTVASPVNKKVEVTFTGGRNAARDWLEMTGITVKADTYVGVSTSTRGKEAGEDIISDLRGWPAAGRFAQERLLMGGSTQRPNTWMASKPGEPYNLSTEDEGAASAISYDLSGANNRIRDFIVARTVLIFTDDAMWHLASSKISAEDAPELRRSDAPGIEPHLPPLTIGNAIYYPQAGGQAIIQVTYSELAQNFLGDNASVLSAFLVAMPQDWTLRRATAGNDADMLMFINADGRMVTQTLMRTQEISGFAPHATDGAYVSLCTGADQTVWQICLRDVAGTFRHVLERMEPDQQLDSATAFHFGTPATTLTGLAGYEGQELHVVADGKWQGEFMVAGGAITLPRAVTAARAGLWTPPHAIDPAFQPDEEAQRPMARLKRVFGVEVSVMDTEALAVACNGGDPVPMLINAPVTGVIELEGFPGFTREAQVTITQTIPGRLKLRSLKKKMAA